MPVNMKKAVAIVLGTMLALSAAPVMAFDGVGVMGDSLTAGARPDWWPGILQNHRGVNFGGPTQPYNVARVGEMTFTLLMSGQHTDTAAFVRSGAVDLPILWIGGNDIWMVGMLLAMGMLDGPVLAGIIKVGVNMAVQAIDAVLAENPEGMIVGGVPDVSLCPLAISLYTPEQRALIAKAVDIANWLLLGEVTARGLTFIDFAGAMRDGMSAEGVVGGVTIDPGVGGGDPHYFFRDGFHPSVTGMAILSNVFMTAFNEAHGGTYELFTDYEILQIAGIEEEYTHETFGPAYDMTVYIVMEGGASCAIVKSGKVAGGLIAPLALALAGAVLISIRRRRL